MMSNLACFAAISLHPWGQVGCENSPPPKMANDSKSLRTTTLRTQHRQNLCPVTARSLKGWAVHLAGQLFGSVLKLQYMVVCGTLP